MGPRKDSCVYLFLHYPIQSFDRQKKQYTIVCHNRWYDSPANESEPTAAQRESIFSQHVSPLFDVLFPSGYFEFVFSELLSFPSLLNAITIRFSPTWHRTYKGQQHQHRHCPLAQPTSKALHPRRGSSDGYSDIPL